MALSDACFEFLQATADAAEVLASKVHHYSAPDYPIQYGVEIDALRRACLAVRDRPYDPEAGAELLRLAASVMTFHDGSPGAPERCHREAEMRKLIGLLEEPLDHSEKAAVPAVVQNVMTETSFTPLAAERLKSMLSRLGKSAYDVAIKIISDIGSATVKKMLGL
ncbi:hypothetical protein SAMN05443247_00426 [Bradyrhizobium erythrophlei]|jgi:hypothetical protein|nr:hypothetical protein SAMN05443247_00426 [Bradyrhizobium erythrophlei]